MVVVVVPGAFCAWCAGKGRQPPPPTIKTPGGFEYLEFLGSAGGG